MSPRNCLPLLALFSLAFSLSVTVAQAQNPPAKTTESRSFEAVVHNGEIVGWEQIRRVYITCGTNEFAFVAPYGLKVDVKPAMVSASPADSAYQLGFRILNATADETSADTHALYRDLVSTRYPGADLLAEASKSAAGRSGLLFNLRDKLGKSAERSVLVALIPSAAGILEFTLDADAARADEARSALNSILRTLRSNEGGKLELSRHVVNQS